MQILYRIITSGVRSFSRNWALTVANIAVVTISIIIVLATLMINVVAKNAITELSQNLPVNIYLNEGVSQAQTTSLQEEISKHSSVSQISYVAQTEAESRLRTTFADSPAVLQALDLAGGQRLPSSLEIRLNQLEAADQIKEIAQAPKHSQVVESTSLGKLDSDETIDRAVALRDFIVKAGPVAGLVFVGISFLIIYNTVGLSIFNRQQEIQIMRLVGANQSFIRGPFLVEAILYGLSAGILATALVYGVVYFAGSEYTSQFMVTSYEYFMGPKIIFASIVGSLTGGVLISIISSTLAIDRYLQRRRW